MKKNRKICLFVALVLILCILFAPAVYASGESSANDTTFVEWEVSQDTASIFGGGKLYSIYQGSREFYLDPRTAFCYENTVEIYEDGYLEEGYVYAPTKGAEFLWVNTYSYNHIYATVAGKQALDDFLVGKDVKYTLEYGQKNADLGEFDVGQLDAGADKAESTLEVEVRSLENQKRYDVITRDATYTFAYVHGAVYELEGKLYYVNYETLGNNYFDANGDFSYRQGTVTLVALNGALSSIVTNAVGKLEYSDTVYTDEYEFNYDDTIIDEVIMCVFFLIFWVFYALIGFLPPIPMVLVGILVPIIFRKRRSSLRWLVLVPLSILWMLAALVLAMLLIIF